MRSSLLLLSLSTLAFSLPKPNPSSDSTSDTPSLPTLPFNLLSLIPKYLTPDTSTGACSLKSLLLPPSTLPAPSTGLTLLLTALGRGTQNYTCATSSPSSKPTPAGALANLFNADCFASHMTSLELAAYTACRLSSPKTAEAQFPLPLVGQHFFSDGTTPVFAVQDLGTASLKKVAGVPSPTDASNSVAWLKLAVPTTGAAAAAAATDSSKIREVYRVDTAGGVAPSTCEGVTGGLVTVEYAAVYYFYGIGGGDPGAATAGTKEKEKESESESR